MDISPSLDVYSSYEHAVPGSWALTVVGSDAFDGQEADVEGMACSLHKFPIHAGSVFRQSTASTFENLVGEVLLVDTALTTDALARSESFEGQIIIEAGDFDAEIVVIPGFWKSELKAEVDMSASIVVVGPEGRLLGRTLNAEGEGEFDAGAMCSGGARATQEATEEAIEELLRELGEAFVNSPRVRQRFPD